VTGAAQAGLAPFDRLMTSFVEENQVPGASLSISLYGKLLYARGFGFADRDKHEPVAPTALFRIASVSKPITAVAVLQLVQRGRLKLEDRVVDRIGLKPFLTTGHKSDPRWKHITVRECLQHTGGWDRDKSYDPAFRPWDIAQALGIRPPVAPAQLVRYMMDQPLDFDPGGRYAYSNLGYLVLGRVLETVTGQKYEAYVKKEVFGPLGVKRPRLGRALLANRAAGEVRYYDAQDRMGRCLYPPRLGQQVPLQYGAENFEGFEAHGGWIASAVDLVRFASAFDNPVRCPILRPAVIAQMWARPAGSAGIEPDGKPRDAYYGCGWMVRPEGPAGGVNTSHGGFIAGSEALLVRRWDGLSWAVLFNTANNPDGKSLAGLIDGKLHEAAKAIRRWPRIDLFRTLL
jgi:N-acyl-D-amino-acid deacylase